MQQAETSKIYSSDKEFTQHKAENIVFKWVVVENRLNQTEPAVVLMLPI
jgi:hypothetical protein